MIMSEKKNEIERITLELQYKDNSGSFKITPIYFKLDKKYDRLIEVGSLPECDFIMIEKHELEDLDKLEILGRVNLLLNWIEENYPDEFSAWDWYHKKSYRGNMNIWKDEKLLRILKDNHKYQKLSDSNQWDENDGYVPIHEEFDRDELDPDLRESWDESFERSKY